MCSPKLLSRPFLLILAACGLGNPQAVSAQETNTYTTGIPTPCVNTIVRYFNPNMAAPAQVAITKYLDTTRTCTWQMSNNADLCNPGSLAGATSTSRLIASAFGANITLMPSCQWNCAGCGTINTNGATDGLPVELMDFYIEESGEPADGTKPSVSTTE